MVFIYSLEADSHGATLVLWDDKDCNNVPDTERGQVAATGPARNLGSSAVRDRMVLAERTPEAHVGWKAVGHLETQSRHMPRVPAPDNRLIQTHQLSPIGCYLTVGGTAVFVKG